jgi:long-chain fatty acid transport protein
MQRHHFTRFLAVLGFLAFAPSIIEAQSFGINEIGTCAASKGFAATGSPCNDASTIFWNPGVMAQKKGWNVLVGAAAIQIDAKFTQDTTFREWEGDVPLAIVPHAFLNYKSSETSKLSYGLGFYVPYGLTSQWTDNFPGRFSALKASLATFYVQPNVAYQINSKWSVGGGPVIGHSSVELIQALDLADQVASAGPPVVTFNNLGIPRGTEFGRAQLEGSALAYGVHVGVYGKPSADVTVGLRFLSPLEFEYDDADATFTQTLTGIVLPPGNAICAGNPALCGGSSTAAANIDAILAPNFASGVLVNQTVSTQITHPAQIQAGFGYSGFKSWMLSLDYAWTGWKRFKELPVNFSTAPDRALIEDYNNTSSFRVGAERSFTNGAQFRLGYSGVASAAPDETVTALLPEQDRAYGTIGGSYPLMGNLTIEGAYLRVMAAGKRGRISERTSRTQTAAQLNSGVYDLSANVFSISLKANY